MSPKRMGRPPKLGEYVGLMLRLPVSQHRLLRHLAIDRSQSLNDLMIEVVGEWLKKQPETKRYEVEK